MDAPDPTRPAAEPTGADGGATRDVLSVPPVPTTWLDPIRASRLAGQASAAAAEVGDQLTLPMDPSAAAFFDVDNTLMRGASLFHLARGLAMRRYFTVREVSDFALKQARFVLSGSEDMDDVASVTESGLAFVKGRSVEEVTTLGEEIFDELMTRKLWPGTLVLAQRHLDRGQRVWLVTATPVELARMIARRLGLTGALGTVAEVRDGIYTGRLVGAPLHGKAKAAAVSALAEREALDLTRCAAYSDSANDVPMLSLVGRPVAVNPDSTLRRHARAVGWEIHDYRRARFRRRFAIPVAVAAIAGAGVGAGLGIAAVQSKNHH